MCTCAIEYGVVLKQHWACVPCLAFLVSCSVLRQIFRASGVALLSGPLRWKGHGPLRGDDGRCGAASEEEPASDGENKGRGKLFVSELFISEIQTKRIIHLDCFCLSDRSDAPFSESAKRGGSIDQRGIAYWAVHKFVAIHEQRYIRKVWIHGQRVVLKNQPALVCKRFR